MAEITGIPAVNIREYICGMRAELIWEADQRGEPRPPLSEMVRRFEEADLGRLRGKR
jgi:hypothetical protein